MYEEGATLGRNAGANAANPHILCDGFGTCDRKGRAIFNKTRPHSINPTMERQKARAPPHLLRSGPVSPLAFFVVFAVFIVYVVNNMAQSASISAPVSPVRCGR